MSERDGRERRDGWARHADEQRRAWLRLSPEQRLAWLEEAKQFCRLALGAARQPEPRRRYG